MYCAAPGTTYQQENAASRNACDQTMRPGDASRNRSMAAHQKGSLVVPSLAGSSLPFTSFRSRAPCRVSWFHSSLNSCCCHAAAMSRYSWCFKPLTVRDSLGWRVKPSKGVYLMRRLSSPSPWPQPSGLLHGPLPRSCLRPSRHQADTAGGPENAQETSTQGSAVWLDAAAHQSSNSCPGASANF